MTKKKYRQQSDSATPLSESAFIPVSHSDDEGNVIIDTTTDAPAPIYEPIPEVVELESSSSPSSPSVQDPGPGPVAESPESSEIDLVPAPVLERVLEPVPLQVLAPEPIAQSQDAAPGVSEPLSVLVLDSSSTTNTTSTPNTTSKWIQFKSWFSKCCRACCCCCCHRRHRRHSK